jgi:eukaryotic-like serine/threonine-protein kinase
MEPAVGEVTRLLEEGGVRPVPEGSDAGAIVGDRYVLERELGRGGTSVVYFARDRHLPNRRCVVKILNEASVHPGPFARKFQQEIDVLVQLEGHEGIVPVSDKGQLPDGRPYFVMQYVEGTTLRAELEKGPMPIDRVGQIIRQTAHALAFAHAKGICHLDLKPGNIMSQDVDANAIRVWVIDFGAAKIASTRLKAFTTTRTPIGTPPYMAPEQYTGRVSPASDVYALGMIAFEMLTGALPDADDRKQLERLHSGEESAHLKYSLSSATQRLIARALAPEPSQRPDDVANFGDELSRTLTSQPPDAAAVPPALRKRRAALYRYGLGIVIAAPVVALGVAALSPMLQVSVPPRLTVEQLTSYHGTEQFPSLSPDGAQVAFSWGGPDNANFDLYVRRVADGPALRLTTSPMIDNLAAWSPDGALIAFVRQIDDGAAVYLTPPMPGSERKLAELKPATKLLYLMNLSWSPDGKWLVTDSWDGKSPSLVLLRVADGGQRVLISNSAAEGSYCYPEFSPTGEWIAYAHCSSKDGLTGDSDPCDIHVLPLDGDYNPRGQPRQLTSHRSPIRGITWAPDGRSVVYGASIGGDLRLWRVALSGEAPERMDAFNGTFPTTSRIGGKLIYSHEYSDEFDIWKLQANAAPVPVLSSTRSDHDPQLSPAGDRVAFVSTRSGRGHEIWVASLAGTSAAPLTQPSGRGKGSPRWSPDGRWVAFDAQSGDNGNWDIYVIDAEGGQPRRLTTHPGFENFPSWSRDGKWIYFRSMRSGRSEVWRMAPTGGTPVQMTTTGAASAWESWDGETLYYTRHDGLGPDGKSPQLLARSLHGGRERKVLEGVLRWDFFPVKDGIYFVVPADDHRQQALELRFLNHATGKTKAITRFPALTGQGLSVSADGKTILYSGKAAYAGADLMLVENFR